LFKVLLNGANRPSAGIEKPEIDHPASFQAQQVIEGWVGCQSGCCEYHSSGASLLSAGNNRLARHLADIRIAMRDVTGHRLLQK